MSPFRALRLLRIGFLPMLAAPNVAMAMSLRTLFSARLESGPVSLLAFSNLAWMLYGSLLNDVCDRKVDQQNRAAHKVLAEVHSTAKQRLSLLILAFAFPAGLDLLLFLWIDQADPVASRGVFLPTTLVGILMATGYSLPPIRARSRPLGAAWTLMGYFPFCFLRFAAVIASPAELHLHRNELVLIVAFLWSCHGITTIALKDVPDAFADRTGGIRSLPNVAGASVSIAATGFFIVATGGLSIMAWWTGLLSPRFFAFLLPTLIYLCGLTFYLHRWFIRALGDGDVALKSPRALFHALSYPATWGILTPAFLLHLRPI